MRSHRQQRGPENLGNRAAASYRFLNGSAASAVCTGVPAGVTAKPAARPKFQDAPAGDLRIEHFQGSAAGVDLVVMGEIGEAFEDAEQLLVPGAAPDLYIAGAALRTEWSEPRELVTTLWCRPHGEPAERAHQVMRLALPRLPRVLAEPDAHPFAVLRGGVEQ